VSIFLSQGITHRRSQRASRRELRLDRRNGGGQFLLQLLDHDVADRRHRKPVSSWIDADGTDAGLRAQKLDEFLHPVAARSLRRIHARRPSRTSRAAANSFAPCASGPTG
jgi:hypothetical protein